MKIRMQSKLLLSLLIVVGCDSSFLDTKPYGVTSLETLAQTRDGAEALLIGAYSMLDGILGTATFNAQLAAGSAGSNWIYGSVAGGDAYKGTEEDDLKPVASIENHTVTADNPLIQAKWVAGYNGVQRANDAIRAFQQLADVKISGLDRALRIAEARFLRGYFHYDLYRIFKKIPYIDETIEDTRISNEDAVLPRILEDFALASMDLPATQPEPGRITKGAAQSYTGIAYLWEDNYAMAKIYFDSVIASNRYQLNVEYHQNFNADYNNSNESILEVQQSVNDGAQGVNGNYGDFGNYPYDKGPVGCCGVHQPSQNLVNAFKTESNGLPLLDTFNDVDVTNDDDLLSTDPFTPYTGNLDPRLDWTVGRRGIPYLDWGTHPGKDWIRDQSYGGPYSPIKNMYHQAQEGQVAEQGSWIKSGNSNNLKLLRYADLLLHAAEAEVELGNLDRARELVNKVRSRAKNPDGFVMNNGVPAANYVIDTYNIPWTDKNYARKAVRFERRIELGMEGHRFFDLVRWGIAAEEKNKYFETESKKRNYLSGATFEAGKDEYMPIPQRAIVLSEKNGQPTLTQNDGY